MWETNEHVHTLTVTNRRPTSVDIPKLGGTCSCMRIRPNRLTLSPGESQPVQLTLDLTAAKERPNAEGVREFAVALWAEAEPADGFASRAQWTIHGRVRSAFAVMSAIPFGRQSEALRPIPSETVPILAFVPLRGVTANVVDSRFTTSVRPKDSNFELTVAPVPGLRRGSYRDTVEVTATLPDGTKLPPRSIPVTLDVVPDLEAYPNPIQFGCRTVGEAVSEVISLRSLTAAGFRLERAEVEGDGLSLSPNPGYGPSYTVRYQFVRASSFDGRLRFTLRPAKGDPVELVVPVLAHGFPKE